MRWKQKLHVTDTKYFRPCRDCSLQSNFYWLQTCSRLLLCCFFRCLLVGITHRPAAWGKSQMTDLHQKLNPNGAAAVEQILLALSPQPASYSVLWEIEIERDFCPVHHVQCRWGCAAKENESNQEKAQIVQFIEVDRTFAAVGSTRGFPLRAESREMNPN